VLQILFLLFFRTNFCLGHRLAFFYLLSSPDWNFHEGSFSSLSKSRAMYATAVMVC